MNVKRVLAQLSISTVLLWSLTTQVSAGAPSPPEPPTMADSIYLAVVDCAFPPVTFTAMAGAFSEENMLPSFTTMVPGDEGKRLLNEVFNRIRKEARPEVELKVRVAKFFMDNFTVEEAMVIASSCSSSTGFTDKPLFDRFQTLLTKVSPELQKQNLIVTCSFIGKLMAELSKELGALTPQQIGFTAE